MEYQFRGTPDQIKPTRNLVLVKWVPNEKTKNGIIIPTTDEFEYVRGEVVAVGPECVEVSLGDRVILEKYAKHDRIDMDGYLYAFVSESGLFATYEEEE